MKKNVNFLFSTSFMGFLLLLMAVSAGMATFIESRYGPVAARAAVYDAWWFKLVILLIVVNLTANMFIYKVYRKKKWTIFLFHIAFVFIFLGAAVTRYISYKGTMHIREGENASTLLTADTWIYGTAENGKTTVSFQKKVLLTPGRKNRFKKHISLGGKNYTLRLVKFLPSAQATLLPDPAGKPVLKLVILNMHNRQDHYLQEGDTLRLSGILIGFGNNNPVPDLSFFYRNGKLQLFSRLDIIHTDMRTNRQDTIAAGTTTNVSLRNIYRSGPLQIVPSAFQPKGKVSYIPGHTINSASADVLEMKIDGDNTGKTFFVKGRQGQLGFPTKITVETTLFHIHYGARVISLPFHLHLNDFQLQRYPGSNSPSSYASEVILIDPGKGVKKPFRIYMNHVLNYRGYRFFQSSYDRDEKGTILSVNHDALGTTLTYIGYFLMTLGMLLSIFNKNSRFMTLGRSIDLSGLPKKIASVIGLIILLNGISESQAQVETGNSPIRTVPESMAVAFRDVLVQDQGGRIKPFQTLASEIVRKVAYKSTIKRISPERVVLSMFFYPRKWQKIPMIRVSNDQIKKMIGMHGSFASFMDFFDTAHNNTYILSEAVQRAYRKDPGRRSKVDQDIIKTDERLNICYLVYTGKMLRLFPAPGDPDNRWYSPFEIPEHVSGEDSVFVTSTIQLLFTCMHEGNADEKVLRVIDGIKNYQLTRASELIPSSGKIKMEILYNKAGLFEKVSMAYGFLGFVLLVLLFIHILIPALKIKPVIRVSVILIGIGFAFHTIGLILRWYISGHAPWSNGYESMIYIAWATMLAGILFVRKSPFALAAGGILAALTLFVAHLSWMSPEITNLVPVLKSYWLTIHVSVITASYGFVGMGMVLGLFNLVLMIVRNNKNKEHIDQTITTLTRINEMTLILGSYFIFIGTFLGGVWANESWGRYWGWDPKETWALVTGLVYVFVLHMRLIPGLRGEFAFNLASVLAFFSVIMTYFGVNYYLSGLHSYAAGEAQPIPVGVYIFLGLLVTVILLAWRKSSTPGQAERQEQR